jgi:hypothetical protein
MPGLQPIPVVVQAIEKGGSIMNVTLFRMSASTAFVLLSALSSDPATAQSKASPDEVRLDKTSVPLRGSYRATAADNGLRIKVSKTAYVNGQEICGTIFIKNESSLPATVTGLADSLEAHFPSQVTPPSLPAGSAAGWFKVADVPVALPGPIAPLTRTMIDYCFSLCMAADYPGADFIQNFVAVTATNQTGVVRTVRAKSNRLYPPVLDCRACCLPDGTCADTLPDDCAGRDGLTQATGTNCATTECTQACCRDGACSNETLSGCEAGGQPLGLGTTCDTVTTSCRGACCGEIQCVEALTVAECAAIPGGTYLGNDTTCAGTATTTCPTGACCREGTCVDVVNLFLTEAGCESVGGSYLGDGTICTSTNCCIPLFGSCTPDSDCCTGLECSGGLCMGVNAP